MDLFVPIARCRRDGFNPPGAFGGKCKAGVVKETVAAYRKVSIPRAPSGASARWQKGKALQAEVEFQSPGRLRGQVQECQPSVTHSIRVTWVSIPRAPSGASASPPLRVSSNVTTIRFQSPGRLRGQVQVLPVDPSETFIVPWFQSPGRLRGQVQESGRRLCSVSQLHCFNPPGAFGGKCKPVAARTGCRSRWPVSIPRAPSGASASRPPRRLRREAGQQFQSPGRLRGQVQDQISALAALIVRPGFNPPGAFGGKCKRRHRLRDPRGHCRCFNPPGAFGGKCKAVRRKCRYDVEMTRFNPPGAFGGKCKVWFARPGYSRRHQRFNPPGAFGGKCKVNAASDKWGLEWDGFNPPGAFGGKCKSTALSGAGGLVSDSFNPPGAFGGKCKGLNSSESACREASWFQSPGRLRGQVQVLAA